MPTTAQVVLPVVLRGRQVVLSEPLRLTKGLILSSGRRDLNPRRPPWQGGTLPLSYSREIPTYFDRNSYANSARDLRCQRSGARARWLAGDVSARSRRHI